MIKTPRPSFTSEDLFLVFFKILGKLFSKTLKFEFVLSALSTKKMPLLKRLPLPTKYFSVSLLVGSGLTDDKN